MKNFRNIRYLLQHYTIEDSLYHNNHPTLDNELVKSGQWPENFCCGLSDIAFVLSDPIKSGTNTVNAKLFFPKELSNINFISFFWNLEALDVRSFALVYIGDYDLDKTFTNPYYLEDRLFIHIKKENFQDFINSSYWDFLKSNRHTLYIIQKGSLEEIQTLFKFVDRKYTLNISKESKKSHICSNLEFRLNTYLFAMYQKNFKKIININNFDNITKDKYTINKSKIFYSEFLNTDKKD